MSAPERLDREQSDRVRSRQASGALATAVVAALLVVIFFAVTVVKIGWLG